MVSALGRPIKVDTNTLKVERGKFARVCVEVDLTISVLGKIWVNDHWYKVQYEGFHLICSNCGCYGHLGRNCTVKTTANETENPPRNQQTAANHPQEPSQQNRNIPIPDQPQLISKSQNGYELIATLNCYPSLARFTVRDMRQTIAVGVIKDVMKKVKKDQDVTLKNGDAGAVDMIPTKPMVVGAFSRYHSLPRCAVRGMRHSVPVGVIKDAMKKEKKDQDVILKNGDAGAAEVIPTKAMVVGMLQTVDVGVIKDGMKEKKDQDAGGKITKHGRRRNTLQEVRSLSQHGRRRNTLK